MNPMKQIQIEKVTLNIGTGSNQDRLEKAMKLLNLLTDRTPVKNRTKKRIQAWGVRPGLPLGCKVTLRGEKAIEVLKSLLEAKENTLKENNFDDSGNVSFGLMEYIDIPKMKYVPEIGNLGLQACVTLKRPGFRIKQRKIQKRTVGKNHIIKKENSINFMKEQFNVKLGEEE